MLLQEEFKMIGLMSGTSVDGLDICCASYFETKKKSEWKYAIHATETVPYPDELKKKLQNAIHLSGKELTLLDIEFGKFCGNAINTFCSKNRIIKYEVDAIASHGHTVFHQPDKKLTLQIGCGTSIARGVMIQVISDFRRKDVLFGGQGAPLAPIGDKLLFANMADTLVNIGGFSNCTNIAEDKKIKAFDICPANILLNPLANQLDLPYDKDGEIAKKGTVDKKLLTALQSITKKRDAAESLGLEWVQEHIHPILEKSTVSTENKITTITEYIAISIAESLNTFKSKKFILTGGGAFNTFLVERITIHTSSKNQRVSEQLIAFKEALIFGFLGVLYLKRKPNCLSSVTGAFTDVTGGTLHSV